MGSNGARFETTDLRIKVSLLLGRVNKSGRTRTDLWFGPLWWLTQVVVEGRLPTQFMLPMGL
ncbi:hypothetical protein BCCGELA001_30965 [Bradyrhizobium sp. CCGE-LA001]|nr:hypothetical protein BCCGELA001_30965 [Bradyrhizobium sp. CCGE-LA001]